MPAAFEWLKPFLSFYVLRTFLRLTPFNFVEGCAVQCFAFEWLRRLMGYARFYV